MEDSIGNCPPATVLTLLVCWTFVELQHSSQIQGQLKKKFLFFVSYFLLFVIEFLFPFKPCHGP